MFGVRTIGKSDRMLGCFAGGSPLRGAQASADGARPATTGMPLEFNHTLSLADLEFREPRGVWEPAEGAVPATAEMPPEACLAISGEEQAVRPSVTLPTLSLAELAATDSEAESDDETPFPSRSSGGEDLETLLLIIRGLLVSHYALSRSKQSHKRMCISQAKSSLMLVTLSGKKSYALYLKRLKKFRISLFSIAFRLSVLQDKMG